MKKILLLILPFLIAACQEETPLPKPETLTREAEGFYCNMIVIDHPGPKAQVFEKGQKKALWFTSVRDALVYDRLPGEAQHIQAIFVHDMGRATSWDKPENQNIWIRAEQAFYVINSQKRGGMGARETVPFGARKEAEKFARDFGGTIVLYSAIPPEYILGDTGDYETSTKGPVKN